MLTSNKFYQTYIKLPDANTPLSPEIENNLKLYPFFEDCDGSTDCSHIDAFVLDQDILHFQNKKGGLSQNVLVVYSQNMFFQYVLSGWEGSAANSHIWDDAHCKDLTICKGRYFLADVGFPLCDLLLVLYHGVWYHLKEWGRADQRSAFCFGCHFVC
jgi:hypothetical protein